MNTPRSQNSLSATPHTDTTSTQVEYARPSTRELTILLLAVICCYCVLYGPQVLLNRWIERYDISPLQASSLVYATLIPMSVTPLTYGLILGVSDTRRVMMWALGALAVVTAALNYTESYALIMTCRLLQGVILPAIMTAVMARFSATGPASGPQLITYYLCATVLGGLAGRLVTGYCADLIGLDAVWWLWTSVIILITISLACLPAYHVPFNTHLTTLSALRRVIRLPSISATLLCGGLMFGGFAAALNLLPLRAEALGVSGGSAAIAHRYWGYLSGVVIALNAQRFDDLLEGKGRAPALGLLVMAGSLLWGTLDLSYAPLSLMVLGLCIGLFITHPLLAAHITQLNPAERGLMSGLYVSSYYIGGAVCSWLAGIYMMHVGWGVTLVTLALMITVAGGLIFVTLRRVDQRLAEESEKNTT